MEHDHPPVGLAALVGQAERRQAARWLAFLGQQRQPRTEEAPTMATDVSKTLAKMVATRKALLALPHAYGGTDVKSDIEEAIAEQFQAEVRTLVSLVMRDAYTEEGDPQALEA